MQELHDALDDDTETFADLINPGDFNLSDLGQELPPPPPDMLMKTSTHGAKYLSTENIPEPEDVQVSGNHGKKTQQQFDTMPRSSKGQPVLMRRSSSVPCKVTQSDRGSTSSSDSGFSPGSPKGELTA